MIWTYPRDAETRLASIKKVAQAKGFYDARIEADLNTYVEGPANPLLGRLRRGEGLEGDGKYRIAIYLATMLKRVPRNRERGHALLPVVLTETVDGLRSEVRALAAQGVIGPERLEALLVELNRLDTKYRGSPPPETLAEIRSPWPSQAMVQIVQRMYWRIAVTSDPEMFITSDNPAFFFESMGLANLESELCFPLSPTHCLHCSHQPVAGDDLGYFAPEREFVREMNRRTASAATKLVFAHKKVSWAGELLRKRNAPLMRIRWRE